jgi:DNA polymerase-3 subunit epsilon
MMLRLAPLRLGPRRGAAAVFRRAKRPRNSAPWREGRWLAVDLELTGLDPRRNEIIAIGAVPIEGGRVVLGEALYTLVRSTQRSEHAAVLVHKLRREDLAEAPPLDDAIELLLDALAGAVPVFHTAVVERAFLGPELSRRRVRLPAAADTEALGRVWLAQRDGHAPGSVALETLSSELGLPAEPPHHALGDALTTAQAFVALATRLDASDRQTVGSLVRAGERLGGALRFGLA